MIDETIQSDLALLHVVGDSISMHYGPYLAQMLAGKLAYSRKSATSDDPDSANGGDSSMLLAYLRQRLPQTPTVNVLLVNAGLHDIKRYPDQAEPQVAMALYEDNLRAMVVLGRAYGARVIWVRTTPVVDAIHNARNASFQRFAEDVARYNAVADRVMGEHGVARIDLYRFTANLGPQVYIDHVHFNEAVRAQQAAFVAGGLLAYLA